MLTISGLAPVIQPQIIRAARYMIDNHGSRAGAVATKRADSLVSLGKHDSGAMWREIAVAIGRMQHSQFATRQGQ